MTNTHIGHDTDKYTYGYSSPQLPNRNHRPNYRRSISLGQILNDDRGNINRTENGGLNSVGNSCDASPDSMPDQSSSSREMSDFEKENLLFLRTLDNSYHRELESTHGPLVASLSNTSIGSTFSDDSLTGR